MRDVCVSRAGVCVCMFVKRLLTAQEVNTVCSSLSACTRCIVSQCIKPPFFRSPPTDIATWPRTRWGETNDPSRGDVHFYDYKSNILDPTIYPAARFVSEYGYVHFCAWWCVGGTVDINGHLPSRNKRLCSRLHRLTGEGHQPN